MRPLALAARSLPDELLAGSDRRPGAPRHRVFYGWVVVGAVFWILAVSSGLGFYNASVILAAATTELDASVGSVSGATGLFFAISGLSGFFFSRWMDAADLRWFFTAGGLIGALALLSLRWVTSIAGLYLFFGLFGIAFGLAGILSAATLLNRWFDQRRSIAISIASTGISVGGILVTPIAASLIDQRSLAGASPYLAAIWFAGIVPLAVLLIRSNPTAMGLHPDGNQPDSPIVGTADTGLAGPSTSGPASLPGLNFSEARTTRFFVALASGYAIIFFGQIGAIAQLFNMVLERTDTGTASVSLSVLAGSSLVARLAGGVAVLRVGTKPLTVALAMFQSVALILLAVSPSSTTLILSSALFGITIGNLIMLQPLLVAEAFGAFNFSRIYSTSQFASTAGMAGGPFALGLLRDVADYRTAFIVAAIAALTGSVFITLAGPTARVQAMWKQSVPDPLPSGQAGHQVADAPRSTSRRRPCLGNVGSQ